MIISKQKTDQKKKGSGQVILEFTFTMIIALIMLFSTMMVFRWAGFDFGWRRVDHDLKLMNAVVEDFGVTCLQSVAGICTQWDNMDEGPIEQIDPYFHTPQKMNAAWGL